jgi:CDP-diacylglycerol---glycerol-3-phosphate 3-phosphatidyltransferase
MTAGGLHRGEGPAPRPTDWNVPNALTVLRFLLVPVYAVLLFVEGGSSPWWRFWAWAVFVLAAVTDGIDGKIARRRGEITNFGKVADPIADKALTGTAFIGLSALGVIWWWVTVVILVREVGITVLRFVVIRHGVMPAGRGGKLKTMLQTLSLGALTFPLWVLPLGGAWLFVAYVLLGAALVMTVVSGVDYVFKAARLRETSERTRLRRERRAAARDARALQQGSGVGPMDAPAEGAGPRAAGESSLAAQGEPAERAERQAASAAPGVSEGSPAPERPDRHTAAPGGDQRATGDPAGRGPVRE